LHLRVHVIEALAIVGGQVAEPRAPERFHRVPALQIGVPMLPDHRGDAGSLEHLVRIHDLDDLILQGLARFPQRPPMNATRPIGFGQHAFGDQEVDHRRHMLRLVAPDGEPGFGQPIIGDTERAPCAALQGAAHGDPPVVVEADRLAGVGNAKRPQHEAPGARKVD
jgi:hypothetical protein